MCQRTAAASRPGRSWRNTAVLRTEGDRGCRVGFLFDTGCEKLVQQLSAHKVRVRCVKTALWWYFR